MEMKIRGHTHVAVIGASGIFEPLGEMLHQHGVMTIGISRGTRMGKGDWDVRLAMDTHNYNAVSTWRKEETPDVLIAYGPAVSQVLWPVLCAGIKRTIIVYTSEENAAHNQLSPWKGMAGLSEVLLGWTQTPSGPRWHTPTEVSEKTLAAFLGDRTQWQLGVLSPRHERPI